MKTEKAYLAAGCFWGVEYYLKRLDGVVGTKVGYCGGEKDNPTYEEVCSRQTGHAEVVEVEFDPSEISYEDLIKYFFCIHDFTQEDGQGPDIGEQYRSEIFVVTTEQEEVAYEVIGKLNEMGNNVATEVTEFEKFWPAEGYHQDYYNKNGHIPYCHVYKDIWGLGLI